MARRAVSILIILALLLTASACGSIYESEYSYSAEYSEDIEDNDEADGVDVKSYAQLKAAITDMVNQAKTEGKLHFGSYNGSVSDDMAAVCYEIKTQTPMGAYAVEELDYELSRIVSYYTAVISIQYKRTEQEIESVVSVNGVSELKSYIVQSVGEHAEKLVLRILSSAVNEEYISGLIHSAYFDDPLISACEPVASISGYPDEGLNRIYEIELDYGMDEAGQAAVKEELSARVEAVYRSISELDAGTAALSCGEYLSSNCKTVEEVTGMAATAYGALVEGNASSLGMALAYKALCARLGIECFVVEGSLGTLGVEAHFWNIIGLDGNYYHVDVARFNDVGAEKAFLMSDSEAWGDYMWDSDSYPVCDGTLQYGDFTGQPPAETGETEENGEPEDGGNEGEEEGGENEGEAEAPPEESPVPTEPPVPTETEKPEETENIENIA